MRMVKGAKETLGWVVVGANREVVIPPKAWERYRFQAEEEAIFISGSKKSGGFGLTDRKLLAELSIPLAKNRILGYGWFAATRRVNLPENIPINPGDRLLTVFGSGHALGFISKGPIIAEAEQHPELDRFSIED